MRRTGTKRPVIKERSQGGTPIQPRSLLPNVGGAVTWAPPGLFSQAEPCTQLASEATPLVLGGAMPQLALRWSQPTLHDVDGSQPQHHTHLRRTIRTYWADGPEGPSPRTTRTIIHVYGPRTQEELSQTVPCCAFINPGLHRSQKSRFFALHRTSQEHKNSSTLQGKNQVFFALPGRIHVLWCSQEDKQSGYSKLWDSHRLV